MSDGCNTCKLVIDCAGLHAIATTQSNSIKVICLDYLTKELIVVPTCVWNEFKEIYGDEADALAPFVKIKIKSKKKYLIGGAALADRANSGFSLSPYNSQTDYYAASICTSEGYKLLTSASQIHEYSKIGFLDVINVESILEFDKISFKKT